MFVRPSARTRSRVSAFSRELYVKRVIFFSGTASARNRTVVVLPEPATASTNTGNSNNSKKSETGNSSIINSAKSTVSEGLESIKTAASGLANQVSHKLEEVVDEAGGDNGNLMMTMLKIVIALLVIIAVFFVARYLLGKYHDSVYSSP